jgi:hypothetical protein
LVVLGVPPELYLPAGYIHEFSPLAIFGVSLFDPKHGYGYVEDM